MCLMLVLLGALAACGAAERRGGDNGGEPPTGRESAVGEENRA